MADDDASAAWRRLDRLARRLEPDIAEGLRASLRAYRDSDIWPEVERAIREGRSGAAVQMISAESFDQHAEPLRRAIRAAVEIGGDDATAAVQQAINAAGANALPAVAAGRSAVALRFNLMNPATLEFVRDYQMNLIREISENTREGVRQHIEDGIRAGVNPRDTARRLRPQIGLTARQQRAVANFRRMLEEGDSTALQRELRDRRFDPTIRRAIAQGEPLPPERIERMTQRYRERMLKYRSEVIARTEAIRAAGIGQHETWRQNLADGPLAGAQVLRFWSTAADERVRSSHRAAEALNADGVPMDGRFEMGSGATLRFPRDPEGPAAETIQCRCATIVRIDPGD